MKYLKIFTDFTEDMKELGDAERGRLFTGMLEYAATGKEPDLRGNERILWGTAKKNIDNTREYAEKKRDAGRLGGISKQMQANASKTKQTEANASQKDKDKDKEIEKEVNTDVFTKKKTVFIPPTVDQVKAYCTERGNHVDAQAFVDFYTAKGWMIGKNKMRDWKAAVRTWERLDDQPKAKQPERIDKTANLKKLYDELGDD